ncbi:hypothetical protein B0H66DRAFT_42411 [Apodospora peruviana]|uniref:Uncharacterized protein n=1 Tax=Apodospora peruviana TaxID=516989 RepID=A0AAE0MGC0_9PEZI|nr:hypothetical protein B0H66DRAFT_42411 [Apodospora peruviana]
MSARLYSMRITAAGEFGIVATVIKDPSGWSSLVYVSRTRGSSVGDRVLGIAIPALSPLAKKTKQRAYSSLYFVSLLLSCLGGNCIHRPRHRAQRAERRSLPGHQRGPAPLALVLKTHFVLVAFFQSGLATIDRLPSFSAATRIMKRTPLRNPADFVCQNATVSRRSISLSRANDVCQVVVGAAAHQHLGDGQCRHGNDGFVVAGVPCCVR